MQMLMQAIWDQSRFSDPELRDLIVKLVDLRARLQGPLSPGYVNAFDALNGLDMILLNDPESTCARMEEALAMRSARLGRESPLVADLLKHLGKCIRLLNDDAGALAYWKESLHLWERLEGMNSLNRARLLQAISHIKRDAWEIDEARDMLEEVLRISEALPPGTHKPGNTRAALAKLFFKDGDLTAARTESERALALIEADFGEDDAQLIPPLETLGDTLLALGKIREAKSVIERTFAIAERTGAHGGSIDSRTLLGVAHLQMGEYDRSFELLSESRSLMETILGPDHVGHIKVLLPLGETLVHLGRADEARAVYEEGIRILEVARDPDHKDLAEFLDRLGDLDAMAGRPEVALRRYDRAIAVTERALGPRHRDLAPSLAGKAWAQLKLGDPRSALDNALRAEALTREHFRRMAGQLAESEALRFEELRDSGIDLALAARKTGTGRTGPETERAWDAVIRSRAMVLEEMVSRQRALTGGDPATRSAAEVFLKARRRLFHMMSAVETPPVAAVQRTMEEAERAERELARLSLTFRRNLDRTRVGLNEVLAALPRDAALVAYVRHHEPGLPGSKDPGTPVYTAFIASPSRPPVALRLGPAFALDELIEAWRREVASHPEGLEGEGTLAQTGSQLRAALWDPVARHVGGARLVLIVPDGPVHLVNFAALPGPDGRYLVELPALHHYLAAERDLIRPDARGPADETLLALGGPNFDELSAGAEGARVVYRGPASTCTEFSSMRFEPLPASRAEVEEIGSMWGGSGRKGRALVGPAATEESFKTLAPGAQVVHVASHGFFLPGSCWPGARMDDDPESRLLLSGLALAGANQREAAWKDPRDRDDGVLTADEIGALDLSAAEWVVLSACQTGAGVVRAGEGVLGLRRAFEAAGAGSLIMSLWAVEDAATRRWMRNLYEARLAGAGTAAAVRQATLRTLEEDRRVGRPTHPFFWAGFVAAGDWR